MTGKEYPSGRLAKRHRRRTAHRRDGWKSMRDAFGAVGSLAGLTGLAVLAWASPAEAYLALAAVLVGAMLTGGAAYAQYRVWRSRLPEPPTFGSRPAPGEPPMKPLPPGTADATVDVTHALRRQQTWGRP